ncbi:MAG: cyclic nucleotide-binding domain-containing protein [Lysobacterales bacterium]
MEFMQLFQDWPDVHEYGPGERIFSEQDEADALFLILSGEVELKLHGEPLSIESRGGLLGEMAVLDSTLRSGEATAKTDVQLARLERERLMELMSRNSDFALHMMAAMANRLRAVDRYISTHIG